MAQIELKSRGAIEGWSWLPEIIVALDAHFRRPGSAIEHVAAVAKLQLVIQLANQQPSDVPNYKVNYAEDTNTLTVECHTSCDVPPRSFKDQQRLVYGAAFSLFEGILENFKKRGISTNDVEYLFAELNSFDPQQMRMRAAHGEEPIGRSNAF